MLIVLSESFKVQHIISRLNGILLEFLSHYVQHIIERKIVFPAAFDGPLALRSCHIRHDLEGQLRAYSVEKLRNLKIAVVR